MTTPASAAPLDGTRPKHTDPVMSDPLAERLRAHLAELLPEGRPYGPSDLADRSDELPASIAQYLIRELQARALDHVHRIESDPWIDGQAANVRSALGDLESALETAVRFPEDRWGEHRDRAVDRVVAFLRTPVRTLVEFVFRETDTLSVEVVLRRMSFFRPYGYLGEVFRAYLERKSIKIVDRERYEQVLRRIDREMVGDYDAEEWTNLFQPVFEVSRPLADPDEAVRVPRATIREAAESRRFTQLVEMLDAGPEASLTRAALRETVEGALERRDRPAGPAEEREAETPPEEIASERSGPTPRWKQFQGDRPTGNDRPETEEEVRAQRPRPASTEEESDAPLWKKFQPRSGSGRRNEETSSAPRTPEPENGSRTRESVRELERAVVGEIPNDQRKRFITKLFGGSAERYERTLREIDQIGSWEQASNVIAEKVFIPHQVNIYSEPAVTFTDLVEARYREEPTS